MACETCRLKKIKCDQRRPKCGRCDLRHLPCHYDGERRRSKKLDASEIEKRLHQMEAVFRHMNKRFPTADPESHPDEQDDTSEIVEVFHPLLSPDKSSAECLPANDRRETGLEDMELIWSFDEPLLPVANDSPSLSPAADATGILTPVTFSSDKLPKYDCLLDRILSGDPESSQDDNNAAVWIRTDDGDEYTGPSSGISLLSHSGLTWVQNTFSGTEDICETLKTVAREVANHLQMPKCIVAKPWAATHMNAPRRPIPSEEVVWTYVDAYFKTVQCLFPVVDRNSFENRLRAYFRDPNDNSDIAWTALMVAVLASGCRSLLSAETPSALEQSGSESWAHFQTAMDLVSHLLYKPASLAVVEALLVMTVYAQGLSSPQRLEYTFCALASQVAQGLGLHRKPLQSWNLSNTEIRERNRLFWVTYELDKTISLRSGRPSLIDDNEISCSFPYGIPIFETSTPPSLRSGDQITHQTAPKFDFFFTYAQYARICGNISKQLFSASALNRPFSDLAITAKTLECEIEKWRDGIPEDFKPGRPFRPSELPKDISQIQALSLSFGYHYLICSVHRRFSPIFEIPKLKTAPDTLRLDASRYLQAARSMILLTKYLDIESYAPGWMLFYYPMTALLSVFTSVVCNPFSGSGNSDIALMEVIVGHLGRLEFMTAGGTAFNKIGGLVRLARLILSRACEESNGITQNKSPTERRDSVVGSLNNKRSIHECSVDSPSHAAAKRPRTRQSQQQPRESNTNRSRTVENTSLEHSASSISSRAFHDYSEQNTEALEATALDYFDCNIDLFASPNPASSFPSDGGENCRSAPLSGGHLQWAGHQCANDFSEWEPGANADSENDHYVFGDVMK
ncbi:fungal-specific transcription factor domain-containing protein [Leptodontidium sp. 2 PMI_412]|nr:fungal-specific transcription factor domain-containing protein [Leptodontidium sp. 2 PMI_412]